MVEEKIGFFKRVKMAIFNFEEYQKFSNEKTNMITWNHSTNIQR